MKKTEQAATSSRHMHPQDCFCCGAENDKSLQIDIPFDEDLGEVIYTYQFPEHAAGARGPKRLVHGGAVAALVDEAQGALAQFIGHLILTDQLHMKYHKGTPLYEPVKVRAWVTAVRKRRLYTRATIHDQEDELLVSSSASWYILPERMIKRMAAGAGIPFDLGQLEANKQRAKQIRRRRRAEGKQS